MKQFYHNRYVWNVTHFLILLEPRLLEKGVVVVMAHDQSRGRWRQCFGQIARRVSINGWRGFRGGGGGSEGEVGEVLKRFGDGGHV